MENLNREAILRMLSGKTGNSSSGGGGGDIDLAGYATSIWVTQNFVSIDFFRELFKAYDSNGNEVLPNDTETTIDNIKAMFGFWTDQYLSALGQGSGGGGGGGAEALSDLLDVELTTLQNGQALIYSSALGKWTNGTAGVNMTQVWSALDSATNEQINSSHLSTALSGYVTTSAISDMATKSWVNLQGFATQTWVNQNFITIAFFDRLFQAYEGTGSSATRVNPNDTTSTIDNIKAMVGFWTEFYLSALGDGSASSGSISLGMLSDVSLSSPTDGQALVFDATLGIWKNGTVSGVSTLSSLTDVLLTSPTVNQVLIWDATSSKWVNTSLKTINYQSIIGSGDISVGGGASGNYLPLTGGTLNNTGNQWNLLVNQTYSSYHAQVALSHGDGYGLYVGTSRTDTSHYIFNVVKGTVSPGSRGTSVFYIRADGKIGINTETPSYLLDAAGSIRSDYLSFYNSGRTGSCGYVGRGSSSNDIQLEAYSGKVCIGANNRDNDMVIHTSHYFGFGMGSTSPSYHYDFYHGESSWSNHIYSVGTGKASCFMAHGGGYGVWIGVSTTDSNHYILSLNNNMTGDGSGGSNVLSVYANGQMNLTGSFTANGAVTALSDIRHKTIIKDAGIDVEQIARMPAVMYRWNDGREDNGLHVGSIAQDWQRVLPEVVMQANDKEGTLSMQYGVAALVSSIITARKVVDHERRIAELERENKELKLKLKIA